MVEVTINCFSGLLIRKKKKKKATAELKAAEITKNGSLVFPDVAMRTVDSKIGEQDRLGGAYEGSNEHDEREVYPSMRRDYLDFDLQAKVEGQEVELSGHISDPGLGQKSNLSSFPRLQRSCSNIETRNGSSSYKDCRALIRCEVNGSPWSVKSSFSSDWVILKKKSMGQVLPSRSRKLWWKLFVWSHRNLHNSRTATSTCQRRISSDQVLDFFKIQKGGYSSELLEQVNRKEDEWVTFSVDYSSSSPLDRVNAWVNSLEINVSDSVNFYASETPDLSETRTKRSEQRSMEELIRANHIIRTMNPSSTMAHISGMGLKVVPTISAFNSLRAINLSNNAISHMSPGALPKNLQTLDLSRNRITAIEGLRDLTRLRVLNLSYNKISRIGQGLANCTLIKELYMAGNKISHVEGLHRLLKLTIMDLSFNKLTTTKALGQLVANYNSLLVINLVGNPVQVNVGEEHFRKVVNGLLPRLTFLNKQPVKPYRTRDNVVMSKAALGGAGWADRRRPSKRAGPSPAHLSSGARRKPARG